MLYPCHVGPAIILFMVSLPKRRGRPRKIPRARLPEIPEAGRSVFVEALRTERTRANAYYADNAREVVEGLSKQLEVPEDPALWAKIRRGIDWILARRTVLNELGRMLVEDPTEQDIERFQAVVWHIASKHDKLTAKAACAYIRGRRMGDTGVARRDRIASLHHDLNAAINVHRQRYPESSWSEVKRALDLSTGQIEHKLR